MEQRREREAARIRQHPWRYLTGQVIGLCFGIGLIVNYTSTVVLITGILVTIAALSGIGRFFTER